MTDPASPEVKIDQTGSVRDTPDRSALIRSEIIAGEQALSRRRFHDSRDAAPLTAEQEAELERMDRRDAKRRMRDIEREEEAFERRAEAIHKLRVWANAHSRRDEFVRNAYAAGVSAHRIHKITGIARTTVARILQGSTDEDGGQ
jgi:hypothetical protein